MSTSYKDAGVDINTGKKAVSNIKYLIKRTFTPNVLTDIGSFGACFALPVSEYKNPIMVSSTDGVGTKLILANLMNRHDTIGECLVNHCVNDILTTGAKPLYFLDYIGTGKLDPVVIKEIIRGLSKACCENGCSLIGGEMAEMPEIYSQKEYDLVGTITGVVEKENLLLNRVKKSDVLIGLPSSGLHTNGYSLARKVLLKNYSVDSYISEIGATLGEVLLKVHRSYLKPVSELLNRKELHAISHITGGGIEGNTKRVVPDGLKLRIDWNAWEWFPIFKFIQDLGKIAVGEMRKVFNLGIGLILVVDPDFTDEFFHELKDWGEIPICVGEITK